MMREKNTGRLSILRGKNKRPKFAVKHWRNPSCERTNLAAPSGGQSHGIAAHFPALLAMTIAFILFTSQTCYASPWTKHTSYAGKTFGKLGYGLKNSVFFWLHPFKEAKQPGYDNEFQGFIHGIGQSVFFMTNGLVQLATFPVPVDVMDLGDGLTAKPRAARTILAPEPPAKDERLKAQETELMNLAAEEDFKQVPPATRAGYSVELGPSPEAVNAAMEAELALIAGM